MLFVLEVLLLSEVLELGSVLDAGSSVESDVVFVLGVLLFSEEVLELELVLLAGSVEVVFVVLVEFDTPGFVSLFMMVVVGIGV